VGWALNGVANRNDDLLTVATLTWQRVKAEED